MKGEFSLNFYPVSDTFVNDFFWFNDKTVVIFCCSQAAITVFSEILFRNDLFSSCSYLFTLNVILMPGFCLIMINRTFSFSFLKGMFFFINI